MGDAIEGATPRSEPAPIDGRRRAIASALFVPTWFVVLASVPYSDGVLWRARFAFTPSEHEAAPEFLAASFAVYLPLAIAYVIVVRRRFERGDVASPALVSGLLTLPCAAVFLVVIDLLDRVIESGLTLPDDPASYAAGLGLLVMMGVLVFAILGVPLGALSASVMARFARAGN